VLTLVVDVHRCRWPGAREPVHGHPVKYCFSRQHGAQEQVSRTLRTFVIFLWVRIRPLCQFLVYPREQARWRVREGVANRLRPRALLRIVAHALFHEPLRRLCARLLNGGTP
jgi:hypothetical protein